MFQRTPETKSAKAIHPLSVLPVFYDLHDKPVLLVGVGEGVLWKKELLTAAGAIVQHQEVWACDDFSEKALAIGAFDTDSDAAAFARAARAAGVPVNTVDRKEHCDFQFGSIVNRSPVVVSISTAGAAPAMAQAVRTRIETLLPQSLGAWAEVARSARRRITTLLPNANDRKSFWRRFAEKALVSDASEAEAFVTSTGNIDRSATGRVTLVGAGPGAGDLLTIRAVRAMQAADVILFDDLVSDEVLDLARREAKRMLVGKRGHRASCRQEDINALMIKLAKQGKRVVRLKSGDPMIFGRAGEEINALEREGIFVDVVPGVTAALAAAASLGVSLTHRDCAQGVKFVTAHSRKGELPELDWRSCADPASTLMVYMGGRTAAALAENLAAHGLPKSTPVVVLESISRPDQKQNMMTLGQLCGGGFETEGPVLIGIGQTFASAMRTAETAKIRHFA